MKLINHLTEKLEKARWKHIGFIKKVALSVAIVLVATTVNCQKSKDNDLIKNLLIGRLFMQPKPVVEPVLEPEPEPDTCKEEITKCYTQREMDMRDPLETVSEDRSLTTDPFDGTQYVELTKKIRETNNSNAIIAATMGEQSFPLGCPLSVDSIENGSYSKVSNLPISSATISLSLDGSISTVSPCAISSQRSGIYKLIANKQIPYPVNMFTEVSIIRNQAQLTSKLAASISMQFGGFGSGISYGNSSSSSSQSKVLLVRVMHSIFSIDVDMKRPEEVFSASKNQILSTLSNMQKPMVIPSTIVYGRMLYMLIETQNADSTFAEGVNGRVRAEVFGGSVSSDASNSVNNVLSNQNTRIRIFSLGGSTALTPEIEDISGGPEAVNSFINRVKTFVSNAGSINLQTATPLSYVLRYPDLKIATTPFTGEYSITERFPVNTPMLSSFKEIRGDAKKADFGQIKLELQTGFTSEQMMNNPLKVRVFDSNNVELPPLQYNKSEFVSNKIGSKIEKLIERQIGRAHV